MLAASMAVVLTACGTAGSNGGGPGGRIPDPNAFAGATSQTCAGVTGVPALYWGPGCSSPDDDSEGG